MPIPRGLYIVRDARGTLRHATGMPSVGAQELRVRSIRIVGASFLVLALSPAIARAVAGLTVVPPGPPASREVERQVVSLAGPWRFRLDPDDRGEHERWFTDKLSEETIDLPGTTDLGAKGYALDHDSMTYPVDHMRSQFPGVAPAARADEAGHLVREHLFIGKAWYQREVVIPPEWAGKRTRLELERVIWQTSVWLDDRPVGGSDSLVAPHVVDLGVLSLGAHRLTIRVDNGLIHNIGIIGHAYGPETQSRWNGIVGRIELLATDPTFIDTLAVFPAPDRRSAHIRIHVVSVLHDVRAGHVECDVAEEGTGRTLGTTSIACDPTPGEQVLDIEVPLTEPARPWDEFHTTRYVATATLQSPDGPLDTLSRTFGFRDIRREGRHIVVNGRRILLRGTLDCCVYPRTGHPPMSIDEWLRTLGVIRDYGFNHVRFHTWCPPEAAFEAADRLGIYLEPETPFWVDDWTAGLGVRPKLLGADPEVTEFVRSELRRMCETYGHHPSFALACIGNEFGLSGDWQLADRLVAEAKARDPRRLYTASTARNLTQSDDCWITHRTPAGATRGIGPARTDWDFADAYAGAGVPVIAHETGQRPVFPVYADLLPKFTGPLKPYNLARLASALEDSGMLGQSRDFQRASARFQLLLYKAEHEAFRRTAACAGYQLLMLNDFTGQSEALVGVLDPFWDSKGVVLPAEVREWNAPTVPLARFDRYVWTTDDTLEAAIQVSHYGNADIHGAVARWSLSSGEGPPFAEGSLLPCDLPTGALTDLGRVSIPLAGLDAPAELVLRVSLGEASNAWSIWLYPAHDDAPDPASITIAHTLDPPTLEALRNGAAVLLLAHGLENDSARRTRFPSVYWSAAWWGDRFSSLGILCDPAHPALAGFPTDGCAGWQFEQLAEGAPSILLEGVPHGFRPIIQPVPDFHYNSMLAHVFETRVGRGRLLVCTYDIETDLEHRPAARQLRRSLLDYAASDAFAPRDEIDQAVLERILTMRPQ